MLQTCLKADLLLSELGSFEYVVFFPNIDSARVRLMAIPLIAWKSGLGKDNSWHLATDS